MREPKSQELPEVDPAVSPQTHQVTRLAPSPTGSLHLGNALAFVLNWGIARKRGWEIVLRIEDLDDSRVHEGMARQAIDTLRWLGIDWDSGPIVQSQRMDTYEAAMQVLAQRGLVYPCDLSRKEIEEALSAPHAQHPGNQPLHAPIRPESFPDRFEDTGSGWRFAVEPGEIAFHDRLMGDRCFDTRELGGDFIVWTKRHAPSYQLAVVVDDHASGVTQVVRGRDLIDSVPRQLLLYRALGLSPEPGYSHHPLVRGPDGRRLAKRDKDTHIAAYRALGGPERVIGLIARWLGTVDERVEIPLSAFLEAFDPDTLPSEDLVFSEEDARWLRS